MLFSFELCKIKHSRALEGNNKDAFHWSRFLIPMANASMGNMYVSTPKAFSEVVKEVESCDITWWAGKGAGKGTEALKACHSEPSCYEVVQI